MEQSSHGGGKSPRAVFRCKIIIGTFPNQRQLDCHTENINKGGIRVLLEEGLEHATIVGLEIYIVKDKPIKCEGKVMWVRRIVSHTPGEPTMYSTGIMFVSIAKDDREHIKDLVNRLLASQGESEEEAA